MKAKPVFIVRGPAPQHATTARPFSAVASEGGTYVASCATAGTVSMCCTARHPGWAGSNWDWCRAKGGSMG